jgi:hypothetical protein
VVHTCGTTGWHFYGIIKRPFSKAAAIEGLRRYIPHFVWAVCPYNKVWQTEKLLNGYPLHPSTGAAPEIME